MSHLPKCQARSRARTDPLRPSQLPEVSGGGTTQRKSRIGLSTPAVLGERRVLVLTVCPVDTLTQARLVSSRLLKQWLWAPLPKLVPSGGRGPAVVRFYPAWSGAGGTRGRESQPEAPSHPLLPGKGLSPHFPQTLALPLDSLLIPFPCCPALVPTTPLTNSIPTSALSTPPSPSPKWGTWELTPCLSLFLPLPFLSPLSLPLPDISFRPGMELDKLPTASIPLNPPDKPSLVGLCLSNLNPFCYNPSCSG